MNNIKNWVLAAILICGTSVFTSCKSDDDPTTDKSLTEKLVGKWLYIEADGEKTETEESSVTTFVMEGSTLKAYTSTSQLKYDIWAFNHPTDVEIDGNKLTLTMRAGDITTVEEFSDITVNDDELCYTSKYTVMRNGEVINDDAESSYRLRCVKVRDDYAPIFIGRWEGTVTSDEPGFVPQLMCEEYHADGTNTEYQLVDGQWMPVTADYAEYFIDGNLLCTRWKYPAGL